MNESKLEILTALQKSEAVYVLMSGYTRMPYVVCDEETFDDEVLLFFSEEAARQEAKRLMELKNPVAIAKVELDRRLEFFTSLFPIGVNCLRIDKGTDGEVTVQHNELIKREEPENYPEGKVRVENPELHLTALYFTQEFCRNREAGMTEELAALYEEIQAHFRKGNYIIPAEEGKGIPMLKNAEDKAYLPIFTDYQEFQKFNREGKLKGGVVKAEKIPELISKEMTGVTINPFGVNMILDMKQ